MNYCCQVFYFHFVYYALAIIIFNVHSQCLFHIYNLSLLIFFLFLPSRYNSLPKECFCHSLTDALRVVTSCIFTLSENASTSHSLLNNLTRSGLLCFLIFFLLNLKISHNNTVLWTVKVSVQNYWGFTFTKSFKYFHDAKRNVIVNA